MCWSIPPQTSPTHDTTTINRIHSAMPVSAASALASLLWSTSAAATEAVDAAAGPGTAQLPVDLATYVPSPMETPSWEIWVGFVAGVVPFIIATYEFSKRIIIQRRCPECKGSGLVQRGRVLRKCTQVSMPRKERCEGWFLSFDVSHVFSIFVVQCGGMLPWLGWKMFLFSSFTAPGNGGPLQQPKGQTSVFYKVPPPPPSPPAKQSQQEGAETSAVRQKEEN